MKDDPPDELYAEMLHPQTSPGSFTADRKGFYQDVIQSFTVVQTFLELRCLGLQFFVGQLLHLTVQRHDLICDLFQLLDFFRVQITKDFF